LNGRRARHRQPESAERSSVTPNRQNAATPPHPESLDWRARKAKKKGSVSASVMQHVRAKIKALLVIA